jgi:hypothetical protein
MNQDKANDLRQRLRQAWSAATTSDPQNWRADNPAWGQCAVTACVVQDELGGEIVWAEAGLPDGQKISHYFNLIDGEEVDFTREQFPAGTVVPAGQPKTKQYATTREYVLSFPVTVQRYDALKQALRR